MSGEPNLEASESKHQKVQALLDRYEKEVGLPTNTAPGTETELSTYLNMPRDQLAKLHPDECGEIAYRLGQFAVYLQRLVNKENSVSNWAELALNDIIAKAYNQYDKYTKYEMRLALVTNENNYAMSLHKIRTNALLRVERLNFLSTGLKNLSDTLLQIKRGREKTNG
jgi:hypothetical protein